MKDLEYDEFEVVLERSRDGYSARVADSPTGPAPAIPFVQPMEIADLPPLRETMRGAEAEAPAGAESAVEDAGGTKDPEPTDNQATYTDSPPAPEGGSSTTTESPDTTTTTSPTTG
jgi:hypothetical protein